MSKNNNRAVIEKMAKEILRLERPEEIEGFVTAVVFGVFVMA